MHRTRWILGAVLLAATAAAVALALSELREKKRQADVAVHDIEAQLDALDPVTRAAVMTRVGADAARRQ
jgi:predicted outer membrane lipoprotein